MARWKRKSAPLLGHWAVLVADNGEPVGTLKRYPTREDLGAAIEDLRDAAAGSAFVEPYLTREIRYHWRPWGKRWTFVLEAGSARLYSEPYSSEGAARRGVEDALRAARETT